MKRTHINKSRLIQLLLNLCGSLENLQAIISYNWDNIFELVAEEKGLAFCPIWEGRIRIKPKTIPIYYPHGYVALEGGPVTKLVLAESDYQKEATEIYSWSNLIQTQAFCNSVCIFLGTSLVDPNLRRLLRICLDSRSANHYAFLPSQTPSSQFEIMRDTLFDHDLNTLGVKVIRFPTTPSFKDQYSRLPRLIDYMRQYLADERSIWRK